MSLEGTPDRQNVGRVPELSRPQNLSYIARGPDLGCTNKYSRFAREALIGIHAPTLLTNTYFSQANLEYIQGEIRYQVNSLTGKRFTIDNQDEDELRQIMRAKYLENFPYTPGDERADIQRLDAMVVGFCVKQIVVAVEHYNKFQKDLSTAPMPLEQPLCMSKAGTRGKYDVDNVRFF
jgi:hypothetical protein